MTAEEITRIAAVVRELPDPEDRERAVEGLTYAFPGLPWAGMVYGSCRCCGHILTAWMHEGLCPPCRTADSMRGLEHREAATGRLIQRMPVTLRIR